MEERLQKILARAGYGSRRACEVYITAGRVRVNGAVAELGSKADAEKDQITLDGSPLPKSEPLLYYLLNKPRGVLSTVSDPQGRKTVRDLVPVSGTLYPVGRLDEESEGLILLTNDGELTNHLTHPKFGHEKEYRVLVARKPDPEQLEAWRRGVVLAEGDRTAPAQVFSVEPSGKGLWLKIIMKEGRKHQIREIGTQLGLPVVRIIRVRLSTLNLGSLKPGEWRQLLPKEFELLRKGSLPFTPAAKRFVKKQTPGRIREKRK